MRHPRSLCLSARIAIALILVGVFLSAAPARAEIWNSTDSPELLERMVQKNHGHGGGVFRAGGRDGVLVESAAGRVAGPDSAPMTPGTPFEIASITKMFTAVAVLQLVEEGKLRLDSRVSEILPTAATGGDFREVTLREMLSHTSGLPDYWTDRGIGRGRKNEFMSAFEAEPGRMWEPEEILGHASQLRTKTRRGTFHYSDTNYVLLGLIVEKVAAKPLHQVFRDKIYRPLGMRSTWMTYRENRVGQPPSHRFEGSDDLHAVPRQSADWAGGGLVSTARDLELFLRGIADAKLFRRPATRDALMAFVPTDEEGISYGLGIFRVDLGNGEELWGHDGHGNSFAYYWPSKGICFTGTLNQTENDWWPLVEAFADPDGADLRPGEGTDWQATLSVGWDSLYLYRGVNVLRGEDKYGSGIAWTDLTVTRTLTDNDFLTAAVWQAFATSGNAYREFDFSFAYTRALGDLLVSAEYGLFYGYPPNQFISHELAVSASQDFECGVVTLTPSLAYAFSLGPDSADGEPSSGAGSSFLQLRLDASMPVVPRFATLEGWAAFGVNFSYNTRETADGEEVPFDGPNNLEFGLALPVQLAPAITLTPYVAYSRELNNLVSTDPDTFWAGARLSFSF